MFLKKTFTFALVTLTTATLLTGCGGMDTIKKWGAESRLANQSNARIVDKAMVDTFYDLSMDGMKVTIPEGIKASGFNLEDLDKNSIVFKKKMFNEMNMGMMSRTMSGYSYDSEGDAIAALYIENAKKRGNKVKIFRPALTQKVNAIFKQPFSIMKQTNPLAYSSSLKQTAEWYGKDNLLVEYENNRPKSLLVRAHQAMISLGVNNSYMSYMYSTIIIGKGNMRHFENKIGNTTLENGLITVIN